MSADLSRVSGWTEDLTKIEDYQALPQSVKTLVEFIENYTKGQVDLISVGPDREQTISKI